MFLAQLDIRLLQSTSVFDTDGYNQSSLTSGNTILVARFVLSDAMPVNASAVVGQVVVNRDLEPISPISSDDGSWVLVVDQHNPSFTSTIRIDSGVCDGQGIWHSSSSVRPFLVKVGRDRESTTLEESV
jgi:hypothetical protein